MSTYVIETAGLTRRFGKLTAVDGVNLRVPAGSIYGFLGPNGAGKTTTIRLLLGLLRPSAGEVRLLGRQLPAGLLAALSGIGALVEAPSLYPHLTGWENLDLVRGLRGGTSIQVARALSLVGLEAAARRPVRQYSMGMCQRLGLAVALLDNPAVLILDEPTNGLDPAGIREIRGLIRRLASERGVTIFVSSHLLAEVEQLATQVGIIQAGRLVFQGSQDELRARYQDHVVLAVDHPERAAELLSRAGWQVSRGGIEGVHGENGEHGDQLRVAANGPADAALLAAQMVQAGHSVFHIGMEQPSLEEIFLQVTGADAREGAIQ